MGQRVSDARGYQGGERNRALSPQDVYWARGEYYAGRVGARQLAFQFGMSVDSVRRMLRGDTYANVGEAPGRALEAHRVQEVDDGGALERLLAAQRGEAAPQAPKKVVVEEAPDISGEEAVEAFLRGGTPPSFD